MFSSEPSSSLLTVAEGTGESGVIASEEPTTAMPMPSAVKGTFPMMNQKKAATAAPNATRAYPRMCGACGSSLIVKRHG